METLIAILISLLGYGEPADFEGYTEDQLITEIEAAEAEQTTDDDGGVFGDWDSPGVNPDGGIGEDGGE